MDRSGIVLAWFLPLASSEHVTRPVHQQGELAKGMLWVFSLLHVVSMVHCDAGGCQLQVAAAAIGF